MRAAIVARIALGLPLLLLAGAVNAAPAFPQLGIPVLDGANVDAVADVAAETAVQPRAPLHTRVRLDDDRSSMRTFRPGFSFWQHIFTVPDGAVAFGSALNGRLLAVFPLRGDWSAEGRFEDESLARLLEGQTLDRNLARRREQVAALLEEAVGPVIHNETRGEFLLPNARRYGTFVSEWGAIYERFGVPAEIGLAQAILESGLNGRVRSEAHALGFCQWLPSNWERMDRLSPHVLEGYNQTTQAPYCAAYLTVLATKYGSFIPALSEHHAGGTNVGRIVFTGGRLGAVGARQQYLIGSRFARDLRDMAHGEYRAIYATYGPRSYRYAEMVFGNAENVRRLESSIPQQAIHAMRARRAIPLSEITRRTGLSADEVKRFNPALVLRVPAGATLYLPTQIDDFGSDVAFWRRPATPEFASLMDEFVRLDEPGERWNDPAFRVVLQDFRRRFEATGTEEGSVMATAIAYAMQEMYGEQRLEILEDYIESVRIRELFVRGVLERAATREAEVLGERRSVEMLMRVPRGAAAGAKLGRVHTNRFPD